MQVLEIKTFALAGEVFTGDFRRLDANDVRPPVGEMPHAGRARARQGEIEHGDTGERQRLRDRCFGGLVHADILVWIGDAMGTATVPQAAAFLQSSMRSRRPERSRDLHCGRMLRPEIA